MKGALYTFRYEGAAAVQSAHRARSLSPVDPFGYFYDALEAGALLAAESYPDALRLAERSLACNDRHLSTLRIKIFALAFMNRIEEATDSARQLLQHQPDFTVAAYMASHPCADYRMGRMMEEALLQSGIPRG
jgi:tetratricopeptide (TPR) repeat protein